MEVGDEGHQDSGSSHDIVSRFGTRDRSREVLVKPAGFQTNLMVQKDGGYTFADFARVGLSLTMLVGIVVLLVAPVMYSF